LLALVKYMEPLFIMLAMVGVVAFVFFAPRLKNYLQHRELAAALHADDTYVACAACQNSKLTTVAPEAYRCDRCGFGGGAGWPAHARNQREQWIDALSPAERRASGVADLEEAERSVLRAGGLFEAARRKTGRDEADPHREMGFLAATAFAELERARALARDARRKLSSDELPDDEGKENFLDKAFALDALLDAEWTDFGVTDRLLAGRQDALQLLQALQRARAKLR
jgi:hypothetical protein